METCNRLIISLLAFFLIGCGELAEYSEILVFSNENKDHRIGVLVDGFVEGDPTSGYHTDDIYVTTANRENPTILPIRKIIGSWGLDDNLVEVIAFQKWNVPASKLIDWTDDYHYVSFPERPKVDVNIYIIDSPFSSTESKAFSQLFEALALYCEERLCFDVGSVNIVNRTNHPDVSTFLDLEKVEVPELKKKLGYDPKKINIYYVNRVELGTVSLEPVPPPPSYTTASIYLTSSGGFAYKGIIAMGRNTTGALLAHELGHRFTLGHIDSNPNFDNTNVMYSNSSSRRYFSEGQVLKAHRQSGSELQKFQNVASRNCPSNHPTECPILHKRIFSDGINWPQN